MMAFFLILLIFIVAIIVLISLFAPQSLSWYRQLLVLEKKKGDDFHVPLEENTTKLEAMLSEKNRTIEKLQKQLVTEESHRAEFEKVKTILDEEIQNLKAQNKTLKIPAGKNNA